MEVGKLISKAFQQQVFFPGFSFEEGGAICHYFSPASPSSTEPSLFLALPKAPSQKALENQLEACPSAGYKVLSHP